MTESTNFDIDSLLDGTLDDLADMPEYKPFPAGAHLATIMKWEQKTMPDKKDASKTNVIMNVRLAAKETVEPAVADEVVSPGQETEYGFFLIHHSAPKAMEMGQGQFKEIMKSLAGHFGAKSNRELIADSTGADVLIVTGFRADKTDKTKKYSQLENLKVV